MAEAESALVGKVGRSPLAWLAPLGSLLPVRRRDQAIDAATDRYFAFISYCHGGRDEVEAAWLQTAIETYQLPPTLAERLKRQGPLGKVFLDNSEMAASQHLKVAIKAALAKSENLIVLCSPRSAQSEWVNTEITDFVGLGRQSRIFAVLVDGEPEDAIPPALQKISNLAPGDVALAIEQRDEPLAADLRPDPDISTTRIRRTALLRLLAGMLGLGFDDLRNRHQERLQRRQRMIFAAAAVAAGVLLGLVAFAELSRQDAGRQRAVALSNQAQALIHLGDGAWETHNVLDAEIDYAASIVAADTRQARENLLEVRARGIDAAWEFPGQMAGNALAVTPDGTEVVAAHTDGVIRVWSVAAADLRLALPANPDSIQAVAVAPDGKAIASGSSKGRIMAFDGMTGAVVADYQPTEGSVIALGFDRNGTIWSLSADNVLAARDPGGAVRTIPLPGAQIMSAVISAGAASAAEPLIVVGDKRGFIRRIDPATGADLKAFAADKLAIGAIALDSTGTMVAEWGSNDRYVGTPDPCMCVRVWSLDTQQKLHELIESPGFPGSGNLAFAPDGSHIAIGAMDGIKVWTLNGGAVIKQPKVGIEGAVSAVAFSRDSREILAIGGNLRRYSAETAKPIAWLQGHASAILAMAYSRDGQWIASAGIDGAVRIQDAASGAEAEVITGLSRGLTSIAFDASGQSLMGCTLDGNAVVLDRRKPDAPPLRLDVPAAEGTADQCASLDPATGEIAALNNGNVSLFTLSGDLERQTEIGDGKARGVVFSPDGSALAMADDTGTISLYQAGYAGFGEPVTLAPSIERETSMAISPNNRLLAAVADTRVEIWDTGRPGAPVHQVTLTQPGKNLVFSPDGQLIAIGGYGGVVVVDAISGKIVAELNPYQTYLSWAQAVAIDPTGTRLVVGMSEAMIKAYSLGDGREARTIRPPDRMPGDYDFVPDIAFWAKENLLAVTGYDKSIRLYTLADGRLADTFRENSFESGSGLTFSTDGSQLIAGSSNGVIRVINRADSSERDIPVLTETQPVRALTLSPDQSRAAFATHAANAPEVVTDDTDIVVWNMKENKIEMQLVGHGRTVLDLAFHPTLPILASASYDTTARLWDLDHPGTFSELEDHGGSVTSIAFSPDGKWVATASRDGFVRVFDVQSKRRVAVLPAAGRSYVEQVAFASGRDWLIAGGDGDVLIWQVGTWDRLLRLDGHDDQWVQSAAVDPTGTFLVTTSADPYIRIWNLDAVDEVRTAAPEQILAESIRRTGRQVPNAQPAAPR
jgi:WD40 repeat protein